MGMLVPRITSTRGERAAEEAEGGPPPRPAGRARVLRFACVGALATLTQLGLLAALSAAGWDALLANGFGLLAATQVNFALSSAFTWRDRRATVRGLPRRWARFMVIVAATLVLNQGMFFVLHGILPALVASAAGSGVAALLNFVLGDRFVFLA